jgi:hypothetical protein
VSVLTFVVRGSHLNATSRSQPVADSAAFCSSVSGSICSRRLGNQVGSLRHILTVLLVVLNRGKCYLLV